MHSCLIYHHCLQFITQTVGLFFMPDFLVMVRKSALQYLGYKNKLERKNVQICKTFMISRTRSCDINLPLNPQWTCIRAEASECHIRQSWTISDHGEFTLYLLFSICSNLFKLNRISIICVWGGGDGDTSRRVNIYFPS